MRSITIISGGQTGADRAALDFAIAHGLAHGGWCPRGRRAEDGVIPARYELQETPSPKYAERTEWNVRDSDATVIFTIKAHAEGGTLRTIEFAQQFAKPWIQVARDARVMALGAAAEGSPGTLSFGAQAARLRKFLDRQQVRRLNVAGPRASQEPEIASFVYQVLQIAFCESPTR
jgi:hypothetical protein